MSGWLTETSGERRGRMHPLGEQPLTIGRAAESDVVVMSAEASRRHARITWDGDRHVVEDLGTKNGTFVNGTRVGEPTALREGDEVGVPGLLLLYRSSEETMVFPARQPRAGTLTFLFSDLRDFTRYAETQGDDAAARLVVEYRGIVRREIARAEGAEVKTEGDSFFVVFQGARAALDCAIAILQELDRRAAAGLEPIAVGIGLHAGEAVVHDNNYVGAAVNLASRLTGQARAGEILISEVVRSLLRTSGLPPLAEREGLMLKGVDDPPRVYSVQWRTDPLPA
ncbi:MAG: FHA domain-containing protein [Candidatus Limnocylindria bacterium]